MKISEMSVHENQSLEFARDGFSVLNGVIGENRCDRLAAEVCARSTARAGDRHLLEESWCRALAIELRDHEGLRDLLRDTVAVQCTLFDKSPDKNWLVALHQDLSIEVKARVDGHGLTGWSAKEGGLYVQPPVEILEQLVAVRLHIDECPIDSGPLRVVRGSHRFARLDQQQTDAFKEDRGQAEIPVTRGGVLIMRPLILHASSKAAVPRARRVLHFVFGPLRLPFGLAWRWAI